MPQSWKAISARVVWASSQMSKLEDRLHRAQLDPADRSDLKHRCQLLRAALQRVLALLYIPGAKFEVGQEMKRIRTHIRSLTTGLHEGCDQ